MLNKQFTFEFSALFIILIIFIPAMFISICLCWYDNIKQYNRDVEERRYSVELSSKLAANRTIFLKDKKKIKAILQKNKQQKYYCIKLYAGKKTEYNYHSGYSTSYLVGRTVRHKYHSGKTEEIISNRINYYYVTKFEIQNNSILSLPEEKLLICGTYEIKEISIDEYIQNKYETLKKTLLNK